VSATISVPAWVKYVCAAVAGLEWLSAYVSPTHPTFGWYANGVVGTIVAVAIYLGWPVTVPTTPPTS
jgi:uncharacterized membrane protein